MTEDNTHLTLTCPHCGQSVETTLDDLRETPMVTCGACGQEFTEDLSSLLEPPPPDEKGFV